MQDLRYQVKVDAEANFIEGQSNPAEGRFVFTHSQNCQQRNIASTITIVTGKLRTAEEQYARYMAMEFRRAAHHRSGGQFTYTSGAILETAVGTMEGYFEMIAADGEIFAKIPMFLQTPSTALMATYVVGDVQGIIKPSRS